MKGKKAAIILLILIIIIVIFFIIFKNKPVKKSEIGNNSSSQEIVDYILNINSYETKIEVEINSNKNTNKYIIKQQYKEPQSVQEVIEPKNIRWSKNYKR